MSPRQDGPPGRRGQGGGGEEEVDGEGGREGQDGVLPLCLHQGEREAVWPAHGLMGSNAVLRLIMFVLIL